MAIEWGGSSGHLSVGIDVRWDGYDTNTPSINVYVDYYVRSDAWGFDDPQSLTDNAGNVWNYRMSAASGSTTIKAIGTRTIGGLGQSYSGGPAYGFSATVSGNYNGGSPSHSRGWSLPARPANVPTQPGIGVDSVSSTSARIVIFAADGRGAGIDAYRTIVDNNADYSSLVADFGSGTGTVTGLAPATTYYTQSAAHNGVGWSAWTGQVAFTTGATIPGVPSALGSNTLAQTTANVTWTAPGNGGSAIFGYTLQVALDAGFTSGLQSLTYSASPAALTNLVPGTLYYARVRANNGVGSSAYTAAITFSTLAGTPVIVYPTENASLNNGIAVVTMNILGIAAGRVITIEHSKSATFASGIITSTLTPTGANVNNQYYLSDTNAYLSYGTWYARAKVTNSATGYVTPWSTTVSFTQTHAPSAVANFPGSGQTTKWASSTLFNWNLVDSAYPNDNLTAYRIVVENNITNAVVFDSTKTLLTSSAKQFSMPIDIPSSLKNIALRWRVMAWDRADQAGAWSGYSLFTLADAPTVTIITPPPALPVNNGAPTFSWSTFVPSGGTQSMAVIRVLDSVTNALVWTETVYGTATSVTPPIVILGNAKSYYFTIGVSDTKNISSEAAGTFTTSYQAPGEVTYDFDSSLSDGAGFVDITWPNANPDPLFAVWKVYRKTILTAEWVLITEIGDQNVRSYHDYMLVSGETYSYSVTQAAMRSGILLEGPVGQRQKVLSISPRVNRAINPSSEVATNANFTAGTGGAGSVSRVATGGVSGAAFTRATWTKATTVAGLNNGTSGGLQLIGGGNVPVVAGDVNTVSMWVRCSKATTIVIRFDYASAVVSNAIILVANTWKFISFTGTAPALSTTMQVAIYANTAVTSPSWSIGNTLDVDAVLIEDGPNTGTYFDGSTVSDGIVQNTWAGVANASVSTQAEIPVITEVRSATPELTNYWIVNPDTPDSSVRLVGVTSDDSTLNFETSTYTIIGRGRHRDYGDELGYSGSITCQVRANEPTSVFRAAIEKLRKAQETYYLRTPFGRLFKVALGDLGWSPLAGSGTAEMGDMTIPYEEVN